MPRITVTSVEPADADDAISAKKRRDEEFCDKARDYFKEASEAESQVRKLWLDDLAFYNGDQWSAPIQRQRDAEQRPCLTINRLPQFVHAVSNEIRQNKPSPKVSPVDDGGDAETAAIFQGLIRHIERQSNAPAVRSYASFYSICVGRGAYRIVTEYVDPESFNDDQEIFIRRIKNPMTLYVDPACQMADFSDARYMFLVDDISKDEYKRRWPDAEPSSAEEYRSTGDSSPDWFCSGGARIAEYFCRETQEESISLLPDGSVLPTEQVPQGVPIIRQRTVQKPVVRWAVIDGAQILEETIWPGRYIPIIVMLGEEYDLDGRTQYTGMVRNAKDAQRMLNYWESAKTEAIALAPKAPYIAAEGQLENHEDEWAAANRRNFAYLSYKPMSVAGQALPPPQRQSYEPPIQAISMAEAGAVDHLKSTTGVYDPSLGAQSNETSGIAIQRRLVQGSTANFHFVDNVSSAVTYEARILVDLIPKIYDRPGRVVRIIGEDGTEKRVPVNEEHQDRAGLVKLYDLSAGRYDVAVETGPNYTTRRKESADSMIQFANAVPGLVPQYADLLVKAMDWPGAQEISERLRPPGVASDDEPQIPPQAVQQLQQLTQQNQQLQMALKQATDMLNAKKLELDSNERVVAANNATKQQIAELQARVDLMTKNADLGSKEADRQATLMMDHADRQVSLITDQSDHQTDTRLKMAEIASREDIARLNAETKIAGDAMKLKAAKERPPLSSFHKQ